MKLRYLWRVSFVVAIFAMSAGCARDPQQRANAVSQLTDQKVLSKIAIEDEDYIVRQSAVERLTDPQVLARIAVEDSDILVRQSAVNKITDQSLLAQIAVGDHDSPVREQAINRLTDQSLLASIAVKGWDHSLREQAINRLTDQSLLEKIALDGNCDPNDIVPAVATIKVNNPNVLNALSKKCDSKAQKFAKLKLALMGLGRGDVLITLDRSANTLYYTNNSSNRSCTSETIQLMVRVGDTEKTYESSGAPCRDRESFYPKEFSKVNEANIQYSQIYSDFGLTKMTQAD